MLKNITIITFIQLTLLSSSSMAETLLMNFTHDPFSSSSTVAHPGTTVPGQFDEHSISREATYLGNNLDGIINIDLHVEYSLGTSVSQPWYISTNQNSDYLTTTVDYYFFDDPGAPITSFVSDVILESTPVTGTAGAINPCSYYRCGSNYGFEFNADSGVDYFLISSTSFNESYPTVVYPYSAPYQEFTLYTSTIPVPAAAWLFGSGLIGLVGLARRKKV